MVTLEFDESRRSERGGQLVEDVGDSHSGQSPTRCAGFAADRSPVPEVASDDDGRAGQESTDVPQPRRGHFSRPLVRSCGWKGSWRDAD
jgi:hypothetical protein